MRNKVLNSSKQHLYVPLRYIPADRTIKNLLSLPKSKKKEKDAFRSPAASDYRQRAVIRQLSPIQKPV